MKFTLLALLLLLAVSAFSQVTKRQYVLDNNIGIYIEDPDSTKSHDDNYNIDNKIYPAGRQVTYSYYYQDKKGDRFLMKQGRVIPQPEHLRQYDFENSDWEFVSIDKPDSQTVSKVVMEVQAGNWLRNVQGFENFNQTLVSSNLFMRGQEQAWIKAAAGLVENERNIWLDQTQSELFRILKPNPHPYIKAPFAVGNTWT